LGWFGKAGIDLDALAVNLEDMGARSFAQWNDLMDVVATKGGAFETSGGALGERKEHENGSVCPIWHRTARISTTHQSDGLESSSRPL
jgi:hypothetical protein